MKAFEWGFSLCTFYYISLRFGFYLEVKAINI